jgi:hypothetical protein
MLKRLALICLPSLVLITATTAFGQNVNDFLRSFGGVMQQAMRQAAQVEWQKLPPSEVACMDQGLRQRGGSVNNVINRGVFPSDLRLSRLRASCRGLAVQAPQPESVQPSTATAQPSPYVVDGLSLGGEVHFGSASYRRYQCAPSDKFPGFTWCHKKETKRDGRTEITLANSILHTPDGTAWYVNRYIEPAFFGPNDIKNEIDKLSARFGQRPEEYHIPQRQGLPNAVIAVWGNVQLEALNADEVSTVAAGGRDEGLLVSFLGDLQRSAKAGVPVYRLGGGAGLLWAASFHGDGRGVLRFLTIDASKITSQSIATYNPKPQSPPTPNGDQPKPSAEVTTSNPKPQFEESNPHRDVNNKLLQSAPQQGGKNPRKLDILGFRTGMDWSEIERFLNEKNWPIFVVSAPPLQARVGRLRDAWVTEDGIEIYPRCLKGTSAVGVVTLDCATLDTTEVQAAVHPNLRPTNRTVIRFTTCIGPLSILVDYQFKSPAIWNTLVESISQQYEVIPSKQWVTTSDNWRQWQAPPIPSAEGADWAAWKLTDDVTLVLSGMANPSYSLKLQNGELVRQDQAACEAKRNAVPAPKF